MSEVLKKMETRRSIRKYKKDAVPQEILDQILEGLVCLQPVDGGSKIPL